MRLYSILLKIKESINKCWLLFIFLTLSNVTNSQDLIIFNDGKEVDVKILGVTKGKVFYEDNVRKEIKRKEISEIKISCNDLLILVNGSRQMVRMGNVSSDYIRYFDKNGTWNKVDKNSVSKVAVHHPFFRYDESGEVQVQEVMEAKGTKDQLYLKAREWFVNTYKDSRSVIELDDKENGLIIGKGYYTIGSGFLAQWVGHQVKIDLKDNKYRVIISDYFDESDEYLLLKKNKANGAPRENWDTFLNNLEVTVKSHLLSLFQIMSKDDEW